MDPGGGPMAGAGVGTSEHSGETAGLPTDRHVPDGIDATVQSMESTDLGPMGDRRPDDTERFELPRRADAMLASRRLGQRSIPVRSYFVQHATTKYERTSSLPPRGRTDPGLCDRGEVREQGRGGVAAVQGDHAAGGVGGGAAEVDARDRRARREADLPHLVGRHLALEDVAAGEADALLDVGRAEDFRFLEAVREVGGEAGDQVDELLLDVLAPAVPIAVLDVVGRVLAEDREQVAIGGRRRRVVAGLDV